MKPDCSNEAIQTYIKIQEAQPAHLSTLLNKEVGYFVHIQTQAQTPTSLQPPSSSLASTSSSPFPPPLSPPPLPLPKQKTLKLKNCIDSQKTNAELYKLFSKDFLTNIRKSHNQMVLCCGLQENARMETSIGCKKNPGMFLILGIGILDEKYQEDFMKFDVEVSFMGYEEGRVYDLLAWTGVPLERVRQEQDISFGQTYCKITTFGQFLKLFKIALFNNKERDLKTESPPNPDLTTPEKIKSTLIMTIVTKRYGNFLKPSQTQIQKNVVIDFAGSRPSGFEREVGVSSGGGGGGVQGGSGGTGLQFQQQKNVWDCFLIELNNLTGRKKIHYHLVEPNPLLCLIKSLLHSGKTYLLPSFTTNSANFQQNYKYFSQITQLVDQISSNSSLNPPTSLQPQSPSSLSLTLTLHQKFQPYLTLTPTEPDLLAQLLDSLTLLQTSIKTKKYSSLRQYRQIKQKCINAISRLGLWVQGYRKIFNRLLGNKRESRLIGLQSVGDQMRLIGVCVKSENYKDFYAAKSYLALEREIGIKTEGWREQLIALSTQKSQLIKKFHDLHKKNLQTLTTLPQNLEIPPLKPTLTKSLNFLSTLFYNILLYSQRTLADQILRQENINENLNTVYKRLMALDCEVCNMGRNGTILFQVSQVKRDAHLAFLVREVQGILRKDGKEGREGREGRERKGSGGGNISMRKLGKQTNKSKNQNLPPGQTLANTMKQHTSSTKFTKLPSLLEKKIDFQINGNFQFSSMLIVPEHEN